MKYSDAQKALISAVQDFFTAQSFDSASIQWENRDFHPQGKRLWVSVFYVPNPANLASLGQKGLDRLTGFLQIDFNTPQGTGDGATHGLIDAATTEFYAGQVYDRNGVSVVIESCGIIPGRLVENFYRKSLSIVFRADLERP